MDLNIQNKARENLRARLDTVPFQASWNHFRAAGPVASTRPLAIKFQSPWRHSGSNPIDEHYLAIYRQLIILNAVQ